MDEKKLNFKENDKLNREKFADKLIELILNSNAGDYTHEEDESLVIALNSSWGTGKTHFSKMWETKLEEEYKDELEVIKYNAWESDDWKDAFVPILDKLITELNNLDETLKEEIKAKFWSILKYIGTGVAKKIIEKFDDKIIPKIIEKLQELTEDNFEEWFDEGFIESYKELKEKLNTKNLNKIKELLEYVKLDKINEIILKQKMNLSVLDEYEEYKNSKIEFNKCLKKISESDNYKNKKIIFIIDELDRCRPTFAIETLEAIKHFMNIKNVVYVFAIDMEQLSHSIATYYGQNMDSQGYLRRFFHLNFSLGVNSKHIVDYINQLKTETKNSTIEYEILKECCNLFDISIRDLNVIFKNILILHRTILREVTVDQKIRFYYLFLLFKLIKPEVYKHILFENFSETIYYLQDIKRRHNNPVFEVNNNLLRIIQPIYNKENFKVMLEALGGKKNLKSLKELNDDMYLTPWCINNSGDSFNKNITVGEYIDDKLSMLSE